ncbi:hypothetical protein UY3_13218 [Chelonia mydas]|uniref:Uncharacterized protein n=1 Tax=Chelonia mydas TaxID=8469 RepID=M7AY34_CHEMY|nr:hypothetical protein UY3_13218 [Chelonia mydas]
MDDAMVLKSNASQALSAEPTTGDLGLPGATEKPPPLCPVATEIETKMVLEGGDLGQDVPSGRGCIFRIEQEKPLVKKGSKNCSETGLVRLLAATLDDSGLIPSMDKARNMPLLLPKNLPSQQDQTGTNVRTMKPSLLTAAFGSF